MEHLMTSTHQLSMTYAVQSFDKTGPMRGPYMVCTGFVRAGWDVDIVTALSDQNRDMNLAWDVVPVHKVGNGSKRNGLLRLAWDMMRRRKKHITFSMVWDWHNFGSLLAKFLWGHPYALYLDSYYYDAPWDDRRFLSRLRRELRYGIVFRNADMLMGETLSICENSKRHAPGADVLHVPNCIWLRDVEAVEQAWRAEGYAPERRPVILFAGQVIPRKGVHDLLTAFAELAPSFPDWRVDILGPMPDPEYGNQLRQIMEANNLQERVSIEPSLSGEALYRRFRACSIYCIPTYREGTPTSILEAMYFGGAIISGNAGFISYQLDDGACGLLLKGGDVATLRSHLQQFMASPELRAQYMQRAKERLATEFAWECYFPAIEEACKRRIAKTNAR
jgi:glycosyltransferase involved in cell wall biosynthesis